MLLVLLKTLVDTTSDDRGSIENNNFNIPMISHNLTLATVIVTPSFVFLAISGGSEAKQTAR